MHTDNSSPGSSFNSPAKVLSVLFHPVFAPTFGFLLVLGHPSISYFYISLNQKILLLSLVFLNTALLPSLFSFLLVRFGFISSIEMKSEKERKWPYMITTVFYFFTYLLLKDAHLPDVIYNLQSGGILTIFLTALISLKWKISAHMAGIGGITAFCINTSISNGTQGMFLVLFFLIFSGIIGVCRIHLRAHNLSQVFAGWMLGFTCLSLTI